MPAKAARATVLIVEDEPVIARNIERSLLHLGYAVAGVCANADEVRRAIDAGLPDLVLMDIHLEGSEDGVSVAERLRDLHALPVVYLAGLMDDATLERAKITQPFGYIAKPFSQRELQITLEIALYKAEMEKRLAEQEIHIQRIIDSISQGFCLLDDAGMVRYANSALAEMLGRPIAELTGQPADNWLVLHLEEDDAISDAWLAEKPCELEVRRSDGGTRAVVVTSQHIVDGDGMHTGSFLSITDLAAVARKPDGDD